jgi:hypothetical protein
MAARDLARPLFAVACLTLTALGLNNVYGDASSTRALAEQTACGGEHCSVAQLSESRSAFKHGFGFQTTLVRQGDAKGAKTATVDVECQRAYVLIGAPSCKVTSGGLPPAASSAR